MGLDNGIYIKQKKERIDICYWRKWREFRRELFFELPLEDNGITKLSREDLAVILRVLCRTSLEYWDDLDREGMEQLKEDSMNQIAGLILLLDGNTEDLEVYFYDSY